MKNVFKKCKKTKYIVFIDFSNHAGAQVSIFTPKMKKMEFARLARFARPCTRKWDFRRRSQPRELAQRSQDDVSLNKLPQIRGNECMFRLRFADPAENTLSKMVHCNFETASLLTASSTHPLRQSNTSRTSVWILHRARNMTV